MTTTITLRSERMALVHETLGYHVPQEELAGWSAEMKMAAARTIDRLIDAGALPAMRPSPFRPVTQDWTHGLPMMQQSVLLTAVRGPDGLTKYHPVKYLLRWLRRCLLLSAMDGRVLADPFEPNGGSFTGPSVRTTTDTGVEPVQYLAGGSLRDASSHLPTGAGWRATWEEALDDWVTEYLRCLDEVPHHFQLHFMHAVEIVGYKHPDEQIRSWWAGVYERLVHDMHLWPESEEQLDARLGDSREGWLHRADPATVA